MYTCTSVLLLLKCLLFRCCVPEIDGSCTNGTALYRTAFDLNETAIFTNPDEESLCHRCNYNTTIAVGKVCIQGSEVSRGQLLQCSDETHTKQ